jgi:5-(hydroxymethyl)furfural/furfural oxidase
VDQNGNFEDGIFPPAFSNRDDARVSAAAAYLDNATRARKNLAIAAETQVIGLTMDGRRASGARLRKVDGTEHRVKAQHVFVTAGALQTPAILMRAGIGPAAHLRACGIDVLIDRAGVGGNLRDHPAITIAQYLPPMLRLSTEFRRASLIAMRYTSGLPGGSASDMYVSAAARAGWHSLGASLGLYFLWVNAPKSVGRLSLNPNDPASYPRIDLNLLDDAADHARLADGIRRLVALTLSSHLNPDPDDIFPASFSPAVKRLSAVSERNRKIATVLAWLLDGAPFLRRIMLRTFTGNVRLASLVHDDALLEEFVRNNVFGVWHASGTCRMGGVADPRAVVDPAGRVIGVGGLTVADASVMPLLPTANTNIPTMMIAEKIADGFRTGARAAD